MISIFQKFIRYFKSLFSSHNQPEVEKNVKQLEYYIPPLDRTKSLELFRDVKVGDIIYAPTSYDSRQLKKLSITHRQRPYLVVKKEFNYIRGFSGTSDTKIKYKLPFELDKDSYNVSKDGLIELGKISNISGDTILSLNDSLAIRDMLKINRAIYTSELINKTMFVLDLELKPGMLIGTPTNSLYFVYKNDGSNLTLYYLQEESSTVEYIFNSKRYYIDANNPYDTDKISNYVILSSNETRIVKEIDNVLSGKEINDPIDYDNNELFGEKYPTPPSKKHDRFKNNHYFKYDIGQILVMGDRTFVYLFSSFYEDYAVEVFDDESISPLMRIEHYIDYLNKDGMLEDDDILDIVAETAEGNSKCDWLLELVEKQYGYDDLQEETDTEDTDKIKEE